MNGTVADIGDGKNANYLKFVPRQEGTMILTIDEVSNSTRIDLETDRLPFDNNSMDITLMLNLLEHIFNHRYVLSEARRITKANGKLIGYVPFLVRYHPHPHDYFRYTKEALTKLLEETGWEEIEVRECGSGPFYVFFQTFMLFMPKIIRLIIWPFIYALNSLYLKLRPHAYDRYPLGYIFCAKVAETGE